MNILVTGGASGLGEAIVRIFAKNTNNNVYCTYNSSKKNADLLASEFPNVNPIKCDFRNSNELESLLESIVTFDLNVLINNAYGGSFLKTHFHKISSDEFLTEFKENILPVIEITQTVIKEFRKKKAGKIVTILTSALSEKAPVGSSSYISMKAYLEKLTQIWAIENERFNISSQSVSPSLMRTNLTANLDERLVEQIIENHPQRKLLTVETVAEKILFLVQTAPKLNGFDIVIN